MLGWSGRVDRTTFENSVTCLVIRAGVAMSNMIAFHFPEDPELQDISRSNPVEELRSYRRANCAYWAMGGGHTTTV